MTKYTVSYRGEETIYDDWDEAFDAWMSYDEDAVLKVIPDESDPNWPDRETLGTFDEPA